MVAQEVKISSNVTHVFTNGLNKEAKEQIIKKPTNSGFGDEEQYLKYVMI